MASSKTTVVMNSLDEELLPAASRAPQSDCFRIVYHGTITPSYGVELLVEAVSELTGEIEGLTLELYGEGDSLDAIRLRAQQLGIEESVLLSGRYLPQADVLTLVQSAHVGVIPNLSSRLNRFALSSKMFEYVALGIPVVSADLPTIREHFSDEEVLFFRAWGQADRLPRHCARSRATRPLHAHRADSRASTRYTESYNWSTNAMRVMPPFFEDVRSGDHASADGHRADRPPARVDGRRPMQPVDVRGLRAARLLRPFSHPIPTGRSGRERRFKALPSSSSIAIVWTGSNRERWWHDSASFSTGLALPETHEGGQPRTTSQHRTNLGRFGCHCRLLPEP